jgi:TonB family protein
MVGLSVCPMKITFGIILLLLASMAAFAQTQPSLYENKELGVRFTIPEGWTVGDGAAKEAYARAAQMHESQHLLLLLTRKAGDAPIERITLVAQDFPPNTFPSPETATRYVDSWAEGHPILDRDTNKKLYAAVPAAVAEFKSRTTPERWFELYATTHRSNLFRVLAELNSESALEESERAIASLRVKPDWEDPDERLANEANASQAPLRVRVSQGVTQGLILKKVQPEYPPLARQARVQGLVVMRALINKQGKIVELTVMSGHPLLVPAAIHAVHQWEYKPYILNGEAVSVETQITVSFTLVGG